MPTSNKNHIAIIGTAGVPACYGGFETLAHELVCSLKESFNFTIYCSGKKYPQAERLTEWEGARLRYIPLSANGIMSVFYDIWSMLHALRYADILLVLGVSGCLFLPIIKLLSAKQVIVNLDGIEWRRAKWSGPAKWFLRVSEKMAVRYADVLIADNEGIRQEIQKRYKRDTTTIAYGGNQAFGVHATQADATRFPFLSKQYAFKVCRIEPENNIEIILKAFANQDELPLVLVGNWQHSEWSRAMYAQYAQQANLILLDPIYEPHTLNLLRSNAYVYVHGHQAGGTNPSLVEAMSLGLPIISYDVIFNQETTAHEALYFTDVTSLQALLKWPPRRLHKMGKTMRKIAQERYTWEAISEAYSKVFQLQETRPTYTPTPHIV
ncbi:MAG: DUF1972 domain-containing protein, partial [Bacteroidia bacterium]